MKIEKIEQAADKLQAAIREGLGPTQLPSNNSMAREAVIAIIKAVANELSAELRLGDCGEDAIGDKENAY